MLASNIITLQTLKLSNMNSIYVLSFVLALAAHAYGDAYNTQHDGFDMKALVADTEKLQGLVGCFLDTHPCSDVGASFKKDFPDAVATGCVKCNDAQKNLMQIFLDGVKEKLPKEYEALKNKYDPLGKLIH